MPKKRLITDYCLLITVYCLLFTIHCSLITDHWTLNTAHAQSEPVRIVGLDISHFPQVQFRLVGNEPLVNLDGLTLRENGVPIADFTINPVPVGLDVVFVLDANETIGEFDGGETTRLMVVQENIARFATQFMNPGGFDQVSVIVPDEGYSNGRFLIQDATNPDDLIDVIYQYNPSPPGPTPLNDMMTLAVDHAADIQQDGRLQTILLFSDAGQLDGQLKVEPLVAQAQAIQLPIFVAILGAVPTLEGIGNAALLYEPTGGEYVPLPTGDETDSLYRRWLARSNQPQITYQSPQKLNGRYTISVSLGELTATTEYELQLQPPVPTIELAETTIQRVGERPDALLSDLQPLRQDVPVQVTWPDDIPRRLKSATLFVDGQAQPALSLVEPDEDGLIYLDWNFRYLDAGPYQLTVQVIDELGWVGMSEPLEVRMVVERPIPPTATPIPTPVTPEPFTLPLPKTENALAALGVAGSGIFVFGLLLVVRRRRKKKPVSIPQPVTERVRDSVVVEGPVTAVLERLDGKPGDVQQFNLDGDNILIGRDMHVAQIVLDDKSVSRLHARIRRQHNGYWLYDEGSPTGTYLNFDRLGLAPRALQDQDRIGIGQVQLRFCLTLTDGESNQYSVSSNQ